MSRLLHLPPPSRTILGICLGYPTITFICCMTNKVLYMNLLLLWYAAMIRNHCSQTMFLPGNESSSSLEKEWASRSWRWFIVQLWCIWWYHSYQYKSIIVGFMQMDTVIHMITAILQIMVLDLIHTTHMCLKSQLIVRTWNLCISRPLDVVWNSFVGIMNMGSFKVVIIWSSRFTSLVGCPCFGTLSGKPYITTI